MEQAVERILAAAPHPDDARALAAMMAELTGAPAAAWGAAIVGFGRYRYRYASGREGEAPLLSFSPRKAALTLYLSDGGPLPAELLGRLGPHKAGKGCLYLKRLGDADPAVLRELLAHSLAARRAQAVA